MDSSTHKGSCLKISGEIGFFGGILAESLEVSQSEDDVHLEILVILLPESFGRVLKWSG